MMSYVIVFAGAGVGGMLRHATNMAGARWLPAPFPYATLLVNISGSLILGLIAGYFVARNDPNQLWRLFLTTGVLGGYTTFSAFSLETVQLFERGEIALSALYVALSVVGAIAAVVAGMALARALA